MAKFKIQKGLSDEDMMKGFVEEETFETAMLKDEPPTIHQSKKVAPKNGSKEEFYKEFLTDRIQTEIGKLLLDIKMAYFKDGYGDFSVQVKKDGQNIVLVTAPKQVK